MAQNNLTLAQELERLDQQITLTLQEIDANFSKAHRIVTSSIIPIVEQYARNSQNVWEGSKFWKEFFEKSANVSFFCYEEDADQDQTDLTETTTDDHQNFVQGEAGPTEEADDETLTTNEEKDPPTATAQLDEIDYDDSELMDSPSIKGRTPKNAKGEPSQVTANLADFDSQYEKLQREIQTTAGATAPTTPGPSRREQTLGRPSPFLHSREPTTQRKHDRNGMLLHSALDKNYKVQMTPHTAHKTAGRPREQKATDKSFNPALDSSPFSPDVAAPQLRAEIFGRSPGKRAPPTPGVSVLPSKGKAPKRNEPTDDTRRTLFTENRGTKTETRQTEDWDSDSEFDYEMGMSPPKTMQFHVPQQQRLMQTPAKEASKRIVEDLLMSAGVGSVTDTVSDLHIDEGHEEMWTRDFEAGIEDSPSVIRQGRDQDDTF